MDIEIETMREGYGRVVRTVISEGEHVAPRGIATREVVNTSVTLHDPTRSLPIGINRALNVKIAVVEALQLIGGVCDPQAMLRASDAFAPFMDGGTFHGGYGQRTRAQIPKVVERLQLDPDTRRAVITMWDPLHDLFTENMNDYPCTVALQFLIRQDSLQLHTHMRSNDVWRGFAYDVFVFTQLQLVIAAALGIPAGSYFHHATSLHIYETDFGFTDIIKSVPRGDDRMQYESLVQPGAYIWAAQQIARDLLAGKYDSSAWFGVVNDDVAQWYEDRV